MFNASKVQPTGENVKLTDPAAALYRARLEDALDYPNAPQVTSIPHGPVRDLRPLQYAGIPDHRSPRPDGMSDLDLVDQMVAAEAGMAEARKFQEWAAREHAIALEDVFKPDVQWKEHKLLAEYVAAVFAAGTTNFLRRKSRNIDKCAQKATFGLFEHDETHEKHLRLLGTELCRDRFCPVCNWRRTLKLHSRLYKALPVMLDAHKGCQFLLVTLTIKNCYNYNLKETLSLLTRGFTKLMKRKEISSAWHGYIKTVEVTCDHDAKSHPHIHAMIAVDDDYFTSSKYIQQKRLIALWRDCLKLSYNPWVNIQKIKPKITRLDGSDAAGRVDIELDDGTVGALHEVLKYQTKATDIIDHPEWARAIAPQMAGTRAIDFGGWFKDALQQTDGRNADDLIVINSDHEVDDGFRLLEVLVFAWCRSRKGYFLTSRGSPADLKMEGVTGPARWRVHADRRSQTLAVQQIAALGI